MLCKSESKAFKSLNDILRLRTPVVGYELPVMYANKKDGLEVNGLSSLLMAPLELQYTGPVLMNNYRSPLVLYGTKPLKKKLMGPLSGSSERTNVKKLMGPLGGPSKRTSVIPVRSERPNVISQRAIIDSGAPTCIFGIFRMR